MSKDKWHKGPPPSIGWWPASIFRDPYILRWWNGNYWSEWADASDSAMGAAEIAGRRHLSNEIIEWTERPASWPARSRT